MPGCGVSATRAKRSRNMRPQDLASPEGAKRIVEEYLPVLRRTGRLAGVPVDLVTRNNERVDCLANAIVERDEARRLLAHDGRLHRGRRAGATRAALPRALSRDAGDAAHGRPPRSNHERQRPVARNVGLPARGSARPSDHRVHGQGDAGDARRRPVGRRHRDAASSRTSRART